MAERIQWIEFKGFKILYDDYSNMSIPDYITLLDDLREILSKSNDEYLLKLSNVENAPSVTDVIKQKLDEVAQFIKEKYPRFYMAVVGITGIKKVLAKAIKKDIYFAKNMDDAKEWLVNQIYKK